MTIRRWLAAALTALSLAFTVSTVGALELREFKSPEDEQRFRELSAELRCLVCQNQSLADSDADLARDLRREVHEMIDAGKSNQDIVDFMVARYGDFVLYRPPLKGSTAFLWIAPFVVAVLALLLLVFVIRARRRAARAEDEGNAAGPDARAAAAALLARRKGDAS